MCDFCSRVQLAPSPLGAGPVSLASGTALRLLIVLRTHFISTTLVLRAQDPTVVWEGHPMVSLRALHVGPDVTVVAGKLKLFGRIVPSAALQIQKQNWHNRNATHTHT